MRHQFDCAICFGTNHAEDSVVDLDKVQIDYYDDDCEYEEEDSVSCHEFSPPPLEYLLLDSSHNLLMI